MTPKTEKENPNMTDPTTAKATLKALQTELRKAQDDLDYWESVIATPQWQEFEDSISTRAEPGKTTHLARFMASKKGPGYVDAKARALASDDLLDDLRDRASPGRIQEIKNKIEKFQQDNALFLQDKKE